jgi:hypothetical protein
MERLCNYNKYFDTNLEFGAEALKNSSNFAQLRTEPSLHVKVAVPRAQCYLIGQESPTNIMYTMLILSCQ